MSLLRLVLFSGLLLHKILWEVLKRRNGRAPVRKLLASTRVARFMKVSKILFLLFLLYQTLFLNLLPISNAPSYLRYVGGIIFFVGLTIAIVARLQIGRNWIDLEESGILPDQSLVTSGLYRYIRHPIYFGDLLLVLGLELALQSWMFLVALLILLTIVRQALKEETQLREVFPGYQEYCLRTKRFIPFIV